ncbi:winged helix-turn-helix domain-containing protein [Pseudomonas sp. 5P_3.1_Bac2]|uniref:winged helix-turn-helix domain-containing protein n=1 Tax=Pseudomonas sp. 5P_3.1_Bac2 TaxID=2971617 RepID=UPI0021C63CA9|nr:winged helix-turn-helix domain-containing protein [Pseudomonas sp. 5P_3.1_Bac2]MCU1716390.1 winged helix-turn-helix domain-containing protein [Pseudomonas sp. 5P_3.1_Bac2]
MSQARLGLKIRLHHGADVAMGPGKAELLAAIAAHGSISAAARVMGLSYRRAWLLVETMNRSFTQPLVSTLAGGKRGGGTQLTALGEQVLRRYQNLCAKAEAAVQQDYTELAELLCSLPEEAD